MYHVYHLVARLFMRTYAHTRDTKMPWSPQGIRAAGSDWRLSGHICTYIYSFFSGTSGTGGIQSPPDQGKRLYHVQISTWYTGHEKPGKSLPDLRKQVYHVKWYNFRYPLWVCGPGPEQDPCN
jgi:hypothetical protein